MEGWQLPKVAVAGAEGKAARKQPMSAREQRFQGGDLGEEEDEEMPGDSEPPSRREAEDWSVDRLAAEATADEGEAESMSSDEGGEEEEESRALLTEVEQLLQVDEGAGVGGGRRKRSVESEEEEKDARPAAMKSPRAEE